jgi:hypothetical protein
MTENEAGGILTAIALIEATQRRDGAAGAALGQGLAEPLKAVEVIKGLIDCAVNLYDADPDTGRRVLDEIRAQVLDMPQD